MLTERDGSKIDDVGWQFRILGIDELTVYADITALIEELPTNVTVSQKTRRRLTNTPTGQWRL
jgi:hypothetical protein